MFGQIDASCRGVCLLLGGDSARVHGHQLLQRGEVFLGRLQAAGDRAAAAELLVQVFTFLLGLANLELKHIDLPLTSVESAGIRPLQQDLSGPGRPASGQPQQRQRPPDRPDHRFRQEQAAHDQHDAQHEHDA